MLLNDKLNRTTRISIAACATAALGLGGLLFLSTQLGPLVAADNPKANAGNAQTAATAPTSDAKEAPAIQENVAAAARADAASQKPSPGGSAPLTEEDRRHARQLQWRSQGSHIGSPSLTEVDRRKAAELHKKIVASLMETLRNETNSELHQIAINELVHMEPARIIEPLVEIIVKDADHQLRIDALSVLASLPGTDRTPPPLMGHPSMGKLPILRDPKSAEALLKLYDELKETKLRIMILRMLGARHAINQSEDDLASTEQWISKLQQIARESTVREIKAEAILQLGRVAYGLPDPPTKD